MKSVLLKIGRFLNSELFVLDDLAVPVADPDRGAAAVDRDVDVDFDIAAEHFFGIVCELLDIRFIEGRVGACCVVAVYSYAQRCVGQEERRVERSREAAPVVGQGRTQKFGFARRAVVHVYAVVVPDAEVVVFAVGKISQARDPDVDFEYRFEEVDVHVQGVALYYRGRAYAVHQFVGSRFVGCDRRRGVVPRDERCAGSGVGPADERVVAARDIGLHGACVAQEVFPQQRRVAVELSRSVVVDQQPDVLHSVECLRVSVVVVIDQMHDRLAFDRDIDVFMQLAACQQDAAEQECAKCFFMGVERVYFMVSW